MTETRFTPAEILQRVKADNDFALGFAIDNNYPAIIAKLGEKGYNVSSPLEAKQIILSLANSGKGADVIDILTVPYLNGVSDYTGGFKDYFLTATAGAVPPQTRSMDWAGWLTVIGAGLAGVGTGLASATGGGTGLTTPGETPEQKAQREKAEAEAKRKKTIQWLIGIGVALVVIALLIYMYRRSQKNASE